MHMHWASLVAQMVKNLPAMRETWVQSLGSVPGLERSLVGHGNPLQYSCLESPHGQRSLVGYGLWGHKELDTTEQLNTHAYAKIPVFLCVGISLCLTLGMLLWLEVLCQQ